MNSRVLQTLSCPNCGSTQFKFEVFTGTSEDVCEGVVWCEKMDWFPVEQRVLEFLPTDLQYRAERIGFQTTYSRRLSALGLLDRHDTAPERSAEKLNAIQLQQNHFDWYAENDQQAYNSYAEMPFWKIVDHRTFSAWNSKIHALPNPAQTPKLLLDVGCAQGRSALGIAQPGIHLIGFDISKRMAQQAYRNFEKIPSGPECNDFIVADGSHFPFRPKIFDYVLVYGVLHHLPDPAAACREIARVLKSGGIYFGSENNRTGLRAIFDFLQRIAPVWHEEAGAEPLIGSQDLAEWFKGTGVNVGTSYSVFVPPHLVNILGKKIGGSILAAADAMLRPVPFFNRQAGLILIEGQKT